LQLAKSALVLASAVSSCNTADTIRPSVLFVLNPLLGFKMADKKKFDEVEVKKKIKEAFDLFDKERKGCVMNE
jgi:hypothetical protein